jgi:hypothetical protein
MKTKLIIGLLATLCITALAAAALAAPGRGEGGGKGKGKGGGPREGVLFGEILSKAGNAWTIAPQIPPKMEERAAEKGRELPELPAEVTVTVSSATKFWLDGAETSAEAFEVGDLIVVKLDKPLKQGGSVAQAIADPETAREYIMERIKEHKGSGGGEGGGPRGEGGGGGKGRGRGRPMFGTVTAVSAGSLTIRPEVPDFLAGMMQEHGIEAPQLPDSITVQLDERTKFFENSTEADSNPFAVGDKVAIMGGGPKSDKAAKAVSDYATAQTRMANMKEKRAEKRGKNKNSGQ